MKKKDILEIIDKSISDVINNTLLADPNNILANPSNQLWFRNNNLVKRTNLLWKIIKECKLDKNKIRILDVGAAAGVIARALHYLGHEIHILEHTHCSPELDKEKLYSPLHLKECVLEKGEFPYPDNYFDLIIHFGVMEHIEPPTCHFWNEQYRIVKKDGLVFIDNPNPYNLRKRIFTLIGLNPNNEIEDWLNTPMFTGHYREHTLNELIYSAKKTGFQLINSGGFQFILEGYLGNASIIKKIFLKLYSALAITTNLKDTLYIIGKK